MTIDAIDQFCRALPACNVRYPFESSPHLRAWCIGKRMFAWSVVNDAPPTIQVKANPDLVPSLIANYDYIQPGYHMNKKHWITIRAAECDADLLQGLLEDAHALVAASLPISERLHLLGD